MQEIKLSLLILIGYVLCWINTSAQKIKIISASDSSPLPYATVTNHTSPSMISADRNGIARIPSTIGDTLSVSYVGYKNAVFRFTGDSVLLISLLREQKILPEIVVRKCIHPEFFSYKNFEDVTAKKKKGGTETAFGGVVWWTGHISNAKIAIRLNPSIAPSILGDISFWIEKYNRSDPDYMIYTPLLVSLYEVNEHTDLPGPPISNAPIIYYPKKSGKQTIRLDSLQVIIPSNGIYVGIQYITNEEYAFTETIRWRRSEEDPVLIDTVRTRYGGRIVGVRANDFAIVFYNGLTDEWHRGKRRPNQGNESRGTIKFEATLKHCKDE